MTPAVNVCGCGVAPDADIGVGVPGFAYGGAVVYRCWSCGAYRPRFAEGRLHDLGVEIAQKWNAR